MNINLYGIARDHSILATIAVTHELDSTLEDIDKDGGKGLVQLALREHKDPRWSRVNFGLACITFKGDIKND